MFFMAGSPQIQVLRSLKVSVVVFPVMATFQVLSPAEIFRIAAHCGVLQGLANDRERGRCSCCRDQDRFDAPSTGAAVAAVGLLSDGPIAVPYLEFLLLIIRGLERRRRAGLSRTQCRFRFGY